MNRRQVFTVWLKGEPSGKKRTVRLLAVDAEEARDSARLYKTSSEQVLDVIGREPPEWEDEDPGKSATREP